MKPEYLESMLWEERDGTLAADEREALGRYVEDHPEARKLQEEIESLATRLDDLGRAVPPQDLRQHIKEALSAVPPSATASSTSSPSVPYRTSSRRSVSWLPMAACLLVGVALGFLFHPGSGPSVEPEKAAGAMSTARVESPSSPLKISLEDPSSSIEVSRTGDLAAIRIDLGSTTDLEIDLEAAEGFLLVTGIEADDAAAFDVMATAGRTALRLQGPTSRTLEITTTSGRVPIRLVVREKGVVVADDRLTADSALDGI